MNKQYLPNRMLALVKFALLAGAIFCCFINAAAQTPSGETVAKANTEIAAKAAKPQPNTNSPQNTGSAEAVLM